MKNPLRGEERRVISTKLYRSEFANLMKICNSEDKSVHQKLRELVQKEVNEKSELSNKPLLTKMKEDNEKLWDKNQLDKKRWNFKIRRNENV